MKINKYNETNTDNIYYEGDITVHFKVLKKDIEEKISQTKEKFEKKDIVEKPKTTKRTYVKKAKAKDEVSK